MYDESVQLLPPDEFKRTAFREFQVAPANCFVNLTKLCPPLTFV